MLKGAFDKTYCIKIFEKIISKRIEMWYDKIRAKQ